MTPSSPTPAAAVPVATELTVDALAIDLTGRRIVVDITLRVAPGTVVGLIGPNGSGKSTILRAIYRMVRPATGQVLIAGNDVWRQPTRVVAQRLGVVVQEGQSDFAFTVREVVEMGRIPHKGLLERDTAADAALVDAALTQVSMSAFAERPFATLSGGEKQRVLVARALARQPQVLVLDEPTNHLDIGAQLDLLGLVRDTGLTTLVTLHDLNLAASTCERLYLLAAGHIVAEGTPAAVLTPPRLGEVFGVAAAVGQHPLTGALHVFFASQN